MFLYVIDYNIFLWKFSLARALAGNAVSGTRQVARAVPGQETGSRSFDSHRAGSSAAGGVAAVVFFKYPQNYKKEGFFSG